MYNSLRWPMHSAEATNPKGTQMDSVTLSPVLAAAIVSSTPESQWVEKTLADGKTVISIHKVTGLPRMDGEAIAKAIKAQFTQEVNERKHVNAWLHAIALVSVPITKVNAELIQKAFLADEAIAALMKSQLATAGKDKAQAKQIKRFWDNRANSVARAFYWSVPFTAVLYRMAEFKIEHDTPPAPAEPSEEPAEEPAGTGGQSTAPAGTVPTVSTQPTLAQCFDEQRRLLAAYRLMPEPGPTLAAAILDAIVAEVPEFKE